jgi:hypothetical protein
MLPSSPGLRDPCPQTAQLFLHPVDRAVQLPALVWMQFYGHAAQPSACSPQNRQHHIQIPFHLGNGRQRFLRRDALRLQEQLRLGE